MKNTCKNFFQRGLAFLFLIAILVGCGGETDTTTNTEATNPVTTTENAGNVTENETVDSIDQSDVAEMNIATLKGPTGMGLASFIESEQDEEHSPFQFTIYGSPDEILPKLLQGEVDIATVPANMAAILNNKSQGKIKVLAINTLGGMEIMENGTTVNSVSDLKGKTLYSSGKGASPEYVLRYILENNNINPDTDVTLEWQNEHAETAAALLQNEGAIALLPQPFATTAELKHDRVRKALDLTEEWNQINASTGGKSALVTGVVVVRDEFLTAHPESVQAFMNRYAESVQYLNDHKSQGAEIVGSLGIVPAEVAEKALPNMNIVFITGEEMKEQLSGYLQVLFDKNPESVGGQLPGDDFYIVDLAV